MKSVPGKPNLKKTKGMAKDFCRVLYPPVSEAQKKMDKVFYLDESPLAVH